MKLEQFIKKIESATRIQVSNEMIEDYVPCFLALFTVGKSRYFLRLYDESKELRFGRCSRSSSGGYGCETFRSHEEAVAQFEKITSRGVLKRIDNLKEKVC